MRRDTAWEATLMEWLAFVLFALVIIVLMSGYPVAFVLGGVSLLFAFFCTALGLFDSVYLQALPSRLFGIMLNEVLVAVPLFVFMGVMLERSRIAEELLDTLALSFGALRGGLGISVLLVGMLLAASTGIIGATVITMGLLSLPVMLRRGYDPALATGSICAAGTLGQIIPPSIILVMLGDVVSSAYQQAQLAQGVFSPRAVSVGDLFAGALIPGFLLVGLYVVYMSLTAWLRPHTAPAVPAAERAAISRAELARRVLKAMLPPLLLVIAVLGSIIGGFATPTEAASVGAVGALVLAGLRGMPTFPVLGEVCRQTTKISCMVFAILLGASLFALVFRGLGGDTLVHELLTALPGGVFGAMLAVMVLMFLLGFVLDFIEITFVVVPIVGPVLLMMGVDPVWLGVMIAINLQTSFLTPPFGFALFYLRGVAPPSIRTTDIYRGVMPFIAIQLVMLAILAAWPQLATWLPSVFY
jgi:tripartite ATP-independent transporter DctM subunit